MNLPTIPSSEGLVPLAKLPRWPGGAFFLPYDTVAGIPSLLLTGITLMELPQGYGTTLPCGSSIKVMPVFGDGVHSMGRSSCPFSWCVHPFPTWIHILYTMFIQCSKVNINC